MEAAMKSVRSVLRTGFASGRTVLGSAVFSVLAGWGVRAIAIVTVLAVAAQSFVGGGLALVAFGLYLSIGYDELYHRLTRNYHLQPASDFAFRTVGFVAGAALIAGVFAAVGAVDPTGTFPDLLPANNAGTAALADGLPTLPVGLLFLFTGGLLVVEGCGSLFRRAAMSRAQAYVGISEPSGLVSLTGTVAEMDERSVPEDDGGDDRRLTTDGGRSRGERTAATDGSGERRDLLALAAYDADDPVIVDADGGAVVATRQDCHPDNWIDAVVSFLADDFEAAHGVDLRDDRETMHRLRIVAKRVREDFEERTETEILLPFIAEVPGEGSVHIRRTLEVAAPGDGVEIRPPFATVGSVPGSQEPTDRSPDAGSADAEPTERPVDAGSVGTESASTSGPDRGVKARGGSEVGTSTGQPPVDVDPIGDGPATFDDGPATFDDADADRPVDAPADETVVDAGDPGPDTPTVTAPHSGEDCVAYVHKHRENATRTTELNGRTIALTGRRLRSFESDVVEFDLESFGTRVHVDPENDPHLVMDLDAVAEVDGSVTYESTIEPGDYVTVLGHLEAADDEPGVDYALRTSVPGGVVVSSFGAADLRRQFSRGTLLRFGAGVPFLLAGAALTQGVPVAAVVGLGSTAAFVGGGLVAAYVLEGMVPERIRSRVGGLVSAVTDRFR